MASTVPLGDKCPLQDTNAMGQKIAPLCGDDYVCLNYWRRTDDGRLLFGSIADAYPMPRWLAEARLRRCLKEVYPQLADVPFEHIWGGTLALSRDAVPLIGRDEGFDDKDATNNASSKGGVWYATGFGGHGIVPRRWPVPSLQMVFLALTMKHGVSFIASSRRSSFSGQYHD